MIRYKQRQLFFKWFQVAWHWNWSLTWRWIFAIRKHYSGHRLGFHKMRTHQGTAWLIVWNTRLLDFSFQSQPNMPRRTKDAPDVVDSGVSNDILPASEVSASEADSRPATTQVM